MGELSQIQDTEAQIKLQGFDILKNRFHDLLEIKDDNVLLLAGLSERPIGV